MNYFSDLQKPVSKVTGNSQFYQAIRKPVLLQKNYRASMMASESSVVFNSKSLG